MTELWTPPGSDPTAVEITTDPTRERMKGTAIHGDTPFDVPYMSQIDGNLWQGGCDNALLLPEEIVHLVNLAPWWQYRVEHQLRSSHIFVLEDSDENPPEMVWAAARLVAELITDGPTLVHCQAGLNRSSLVAAMALVISDTCFVTSDAIALLRERRSPACLCNPSFERWLLDGATQARLSP